MANHHQRGQGVPRPKMAYEAQATAAPARSSLGSTRGHRQDPGAVRTLPAQPHKEIASLSDGMTAPLKVVAVVGSLSALSRPRPWRS